MMKKALILILSALPLTAFCQDFEKQTRPIVEEGKKLYQSEMASWYGTDIFREQYKELSRIGGYFSYMDDEKPTCVFYSQENPPHIIGTMAFNPDFDLKTVQVDLNERKPTDKEMKLYVLRKNAKELMLHDTIFKFYKDSSLNIIPFIDGKEKKVYYLSGPSKNGIVIFGNDYLLTYDRKDMPTVKRLHRNIIQMQYSKKEGGTETMHTHLPETGDFITATDICTLMLYEKFANWNSHTVVSKDYISIWDCRTDDLTVMTMKALDKINKQEGEKGKE